MYHHERDVRIDVHTIFTFKIFFQKNRNKPDSNRKRTLIIQNLLNTKNYIKNNLKNHIVTNNDDRPKKNSITHLKKQVGFYFRILENKIKTNVSVPMKCKN